MMNQLNVKVMFYSPQSKTLLLLNYLCISDVEMTVWMNLAEYDISLSILKKKNI